MQCIQGLGLFLLVMYTVHSYRPADGCDTKLCGSLVSKCMLLQACECDMSDKNNCTCCDQCHRCLALLDSQCCQCVGLCSEDDSTSNMYGGLQPSSVETLADPITDLFTILTEVPDPKARWMTYTYPAHYDILAFDPDQLYAQIDEVTDELSSADRFIDAWRHGFSSNNCTVAFMSECLPKKICKQSCRSMGAAKYRWFHHQHCCQCIGHTCLHYGKNEPLCLHCSTSSNNNSNRSGAAKRPASGNDINSGVARDDQFGGGARANRKHGKTKHQHPQQQQYNDIIVEL